MINAFCFYWNVDIFSVQTKHSHLKISLKKKRKENGLNRCIIGTTWTHTAGHQLPSECICGWNKPTCYINIFYLWIKGSHSSIVCLLMDSLKNFAYIPAKCISPKLRISAEKLKFTWCIFHLSFKSMSAVWYFLKFQYIIFDCST